ncbi:MAG: hypothetical protein QM784_38635 [Polyangiaceae bacterium]
MNEAAVATEMPAASQMARSKLTSPAPGTPHAAAGFTDTARGIRVSPLPGFAAAVFGCGGAMTGSTNDGTRAGRGKSGTD